MQFALVDGVKCEAIPSGKGVCPQCGCGTLAKCGPRVMHHWAHEGRRNCDPWWENETAWHRSWKSLFPKDWLEVSHLAPDGEIHRADIRTPNGIVIEVQHSAMTDAERHSREAFYGNLVWIIDGRDFRDNFDIYHLLPDPGSKLAADLVWEKAYRRMQGSARGLFYRLSECLADDPRVTRAAIRGGWIHGIGEIEDQVNAAYRGHHQYDWVRPRRTWLDAACPVYIDLGDDRDYLARLEVYDESGLLCIRLVSKRKFIFDAMHERLATAIGMHYFPLPDT
jgi:competence protein CoiA